MTIIKIVLLLTSLISSIYGAIVYLKKGAPSFNQLIVLALFCFMLGRAYDLINFLVSGKMISPLSLLACIGGFLFIFSSSFGQMDGLVDGKEKSLRKYRWLSLIAPALLIPLLVLILINASSNKITCTITFIMMMVSIYYNFKHLIIPDVKFGIIKSIRVFNIVSLALSLLYALEITMLMCEYMTSYYVVCSLLSVGYIIIIPILKRGSRQWTI